MTDLGIYGRDDTLPVKVDSHNHVFVGSRSFTFSLLKLLA